MNLNAFSPWRSLRIRVTIFTLMIFLVGIWSLAFYASLILREDMQGQLSDQQLSTVSILATQIERELDGRFKALETVAASLGPAMPGNPAMVQEIMERRPIFQSLFNDGVIALGPDGNAIAGVPRSTGQTGVESMNRDTIAAALKQGKSTVGVPSMREKLRGPVFAMTVPIRDAEDRVIGALSGTTNLANANFLDVLREYHDSKSGAYLQLIAAQSRMTVAASNTSRIMQALPPPGINPSIDRFVGSNEGSAVLTDSAGVEVLSSVKSVPLAGWLVTASLPTEGAFAPIRVMQQRLLWATLLLTLLAGALTWWMAGNQVSPILAAAHRLATLSDIDQPLQPLPTDRQDEIAQLIDGVNRRLESLAERQATLRESEGRYRALFEFSPDAIFVQRNNNITFANDVAARLFDAESASGLVGRDWRELIAPEEWPITEMRIASLASGETSPLPPLEQRHTTRDGQVLSLESTSARIIFDGQPAVLTVIRDITERKQTEAQRLAHTRRQRDTLVREVHHRIKNNLQSVAGLLRHELGKFAALTPRLEAAISQVDAIAIVHGLQSADPDEAICLCDCVSDICTTVSDLSQRPVLFQLEQTPGTFGRIEIESREAVSVALVLNELILNAVKHSPEGSPAPTVLLSATDAGARLVIRNAVAGAPDFDIDTGRALGTGLHLVRSLLPNQGAQLAYERDAEDFMLTNLKLTPPVLATTPQKAPG